MPDNMISKDRTAADASASASALQKWGGLASFLLAVAFVLPGWVYLTGNLGTATGPLAYGVADFLFGPVWAAGLMTAVFALRERIGERAPRRMTATLLAAALAAAAMVTVACIRSANRHYHLAHPELNLQDSTTVLVVWATLVAGVSAAGWQFLGWTFVLLGSAGWTTRLLPRVLSALYLATGIAAMFVYLRPDIEVPVALLSAAVSIWQGIVLWRARPGETEAPDGVVRQLDST
jgi:hypothetical protein